MTDPLSTAAVAVGKDIATGASKGIIQTLNDIWYCAYGHKWDEKAQELRLQHTIKLEKLKKDLEQKIQVIPNENLQEPKLSVWGSDNICIRKKKKFGGKNLAEAPVYGALAFLGGKFMQKWKMVGIGGKWSKIGFYFA